MGTLKRDRKMNGRCGIIFTQCGYVSAKTHSNWFNKEMNSR